jgi:iron complex outermembrane recepter protein
MRKAHLSVIGLVFQSFIVSNAFAQASADTAVGELAEVTVTAQRQEENAQHAAVAIDVISANDLLRSGVTSPDQLGNLVPALTITPAAGSRSSFFMRGVGNFTANPTFDSAIAVNYDGVYIGRPGSTRGLFYDLQRVEVLEGPQGTLYGRNATGGAINIIPAKPVAGQSSAEATASYGNYAAVNVQGAANLPVASDGAVRIAGSIAKHDGYLTDGTSDEDTKAARAQLLYNFSPTVTARLAADYASDRGAGTGTSYINSYTLNRASGQYVVTPSGLDPSIGLYDPRAQAFLQTLPAGPAGRRLGLLAPYEYLHNDYYGVNAQLDFSLNAGTFTLIPAWRHDSQDNISDTFGFTALVQQKDTQSSLEARFVGERVGPIDYKVGAFYYEETNDAHYAVGQQALINFQDNSQHTHSYAAFASLTGHVTAAFRLVGGIRYTKDRKEFQGESRSFTTICTRAACPTAPLFPQVTYSSQLPAPVPGPGQVVPLIGTGAIIANAPTSVNDRFPIGKATYRGAIEYDASAQSLLYASVETGFRAGGFNLATGYENFQPEYITAYTAGSKNRFLNNRLQINAEAFYWKYRNQQLATVALDKVGVQALFTQNIGRATIYGLDTSVEYLLTPNTKVGANVQYLHTKYDSFTYQVPNRGAAPYTGCVSSVAANPAFFDVNCAGKPAYNSPRWTVNPSIQQTLPLGSYKMLATVNGQYRTERYVGFEFQPGQLVGSTWNTNAQLSFAPNDDRWSVTAFVSNIENDRYLVASNTFLVGSALVGITAPPRLFGVRGSLKF